MSEMAMFRQLTQTMTANCELSELFLVGRHVMWKQFTVGRIGDPVEMNLDSGVASSGLRSMI